MVPCTDSTRPSRTAPVLLLSGLALFAGGCGGPAATSDQRMPLAADSASAPAPAPAPAATASASPESDRAQARRLAWEAAVRGVAEIDGRLAVTDPLPAGAQTTATAERDAAEARDANRRTALVAARVQLVRAQPDDAARWNDLGDALLRADRESLAEAAHRAAEATADTASEAARAGRARARIAARDGAFEVAADRMRAALALEDDGDGHGRLAVWLMYLGDLPAARAAVAEADRLGGRVPAAARARLETGGI